MADRLLGIPRHQAFELSLGLLVLEMRRLGPRKDRRELRPRIRRRHVDNAHRLNARLGWLDAEQGRGLTTLHAAPEFAFCSDDQVLVERIGVGLDLHPLAATGNHRKDRSPRRDDPHVVLQLRHMFFGGRFFRELPGQHEFGFEHVAAFDPTVEGRRHPRKGRMTAPLLDIGDDPPGIGLVPAPVLVWRARP